MVVVGPPSGADRARGVRVAATRGPVCEPARPRARRATLRSRRPWSALGPCPTAPITGQCLSGASPGRLRHASIPWALRSAGGEARFRGPLCASIGITMSPKSAKRGMRGGTYVSERRTRGPDGMGGGWKRQPSDRRARHRPVAAPGRPPEIESDETLLPSST